MSHKPSVTRAKSLKKNPDAPAADLGFDWGPYNSILLALGVAVLVAGYLTLSKGSLTLAPVLLVTGYCVLIPAALLVRTAASRSGESLSR